MTPRLANRPGRLGDPLGHGPALALTDAAGVSPATTSSLVARLFTDDDALDSAGPAAA